MLDIGCGNGKKTMQIGKLLNITKQNIFCLEQKQFDNKNIESEDVKIELGKIRVGKPDMIEADGSKHPLLPAADTCVHPQTAC